MLDFLQIDPVAFTIPIAGGIAVYWYGIIVTFGKIGRASCRERV